VFVIAYSYEARDPRDFESVYGPSGEWAEFFGRGRGYVGTELLRELDNPGRYLVIDRWESREAFDQFAAEHQAEYFRRSEEAGVYYLQELQLGVYEQVRPPAESPSS
jgi:heme-degrading monooxygenase HmoA